MGIRRLSEICFGSGMFLMFSALFMDKTSYIFNLIVQSIGYYFQYIMQLGWHTDAIEQLGPSSHEKLGRSTITDGEQPDGPSTWMDDWTMFYWGWWISWSPFVGNIFILNFFYCPSDIPRVYHCFKVNSAGQYCQYCMK